MKTCRWRAAAAPPLQPWIGRSPMAVGKSTDLEPKGPPPCIVAIAFDLDLITCIFQTFNNRSRRLRTPAREEGAVGFRRTPPPEKITAATNHQPDSAFLSTALPANHPLHPSYVQTGTEVPPPSRRRSGRQRGGNQRAAAGELDRTGKGKKSPLLL